MAYDAIIYAGILLIFVGVIVFWVILEKSFKCRLRVREVINNRKIIRDYRAKEYYDKQGVNYWKLSGEKNKTLKSIPAPPEEAVELDKKGRKIAEVFRTQSGDIIWLVDDNKIKEIPPNLFSDVPEQIMSIEDTEKKKEAISKWKKLVLDKWKKDNGVINAFQPLTTKQRVIYLNNLKKAEQRKGFDWKAQMIPMFSIGAMALIIIAMFIFWGDIAAPTLEANQQFIQAQKLHNENLEILREIKTGQQVIGDRITDLENKGVPD